MNPARTWFALSLLSLTGALAAAEVHEHGAVKLDLALEAAELTIGVEMPLDSLVGFERAPRTAAERAAAATALARMRDGATLFRVDPQAGCTLRRSQVEAPLLEPAQPAGGGRGEAATRSGGAGAAPSRHEHRAGHAEHAEPAQAAGHAEDGHADLEATYVFQCAEPQRLRALEVLLFEAFRRIVRIDVRAALPHGQTQTVLKRGARQVRLAP